MGGILDNKRLLSRNYLLNFRATFSLTNERISARSENSTDWKSALRDESEAGMIHATKETHHAMTRILIFVSNF